MCDLRERGKVGRVGMCGVNGKKFPAIRQHLHSAITVPYGTDMSMETWPADDAADPRAYLAALDTYQKGDVAIIFTPDDTHFEIAMAAIERGMCVNCTPLHCITTTNASHCFRF
jgi:D-galacturonate reductase